MDIVQEISSIGGILSNGTVVTALSAITLGYFVWRRTRSTHPIMSRLWTLFSEIKDCPDAKIDEYLKQRSALMQFRFITNIQAPTHHHAHELIDFVTTHRIDLAHVGACGKYFDVSVPALKSKADLPKRWHLFARILGVYIVLMASLGLAVGIATDKMVVSIKDSATWFALDANRAKPLFRSDGLYFSECNQNHAQLAQRTGFNSKEIDTLCKVKSQDIAAYVKTGLPEQRFSFAYVLAIFLYIGTLLFFWLYHGMNARDLYKKLNP